MAEKVGVLFLLLITLALSILNSVTAHVCHSSIISLTALFHISQFFFYLAKLLLQTSFKAKAKNERFARATIVADFIVCIYVVARCASVILRSIEGLILTESDEDHGEDLLEMDHHAHHTMTTESSAKQLPLMQLAGSVTFACDLLMLLAYLVGKFRSRTVTSVVTMNDRSFHSANAQGGSPNTHRCGMPAAEQQKHKLLTTTSFVSTKIQTHAIPFSLIKKHYTLLFSICLMIGSTLSCVLAFINTVKFNEGNIILHRESNHSSIISGNSTHNLSNAASATASTLTKAEHFSLALNNSLVVFLVNRFETNHIDSACAIFMTFLYIWLFSSGLKVAFKMLSLGIPVYFDTKAVIKDIYDMDPLIKNIHDLHVYEWMPYKLNVSLHLVLLDDPVSTSPESRRKLIESVVHQVRHYLTSLYVVHEVQVQPELITPKQAETLKSHHDSQLPYFEDSCCFLSLTEKKTPCQHD